MSGAEVEIDPAKVLQLLQEQFPKEFTICYQKCVIDELTRRLGIGEVAEANGAAVVPVPS